MAEAAGDSPTADLREKVAALEAELSACRRRLEREKKRRLQVQACAAKLRRQVGACPRLLRLFTPADFSGTGSLTCWGCAP